MAMYLKKHYFHATMRRFPQYPSSPLHQITVKFPPVSYLQVYHLVSDLLGRSRWPEILLGQTLASECGNMINVTKADCQASEMNDVETSRNDDCNM